MKFEISLANLKIQKDRWKDPKYREKMSKAHKGNHYPKMSLAKRGKNVDYKNIAYLHRTTRGSWQYKAWRMKILKRDNFTCMFCNQRGGKLEVDHYPKSFVKIMEDNHVKSFEEALECDELWSLTNNRTLCKECHLFLRKKKHV